MGSPEDLLTIGQLARAAEVGIDTIRFYERRGLLAQPARTASGYRKYAAGTVLRLNFIRRAKALGFSLEEIARLLELQDKGGSKAAVKEVTARKLRQIDGMITDLERMRAALQALNDRCSGRGALACCPIIEALAEGGSAAAPQQPASPVAPSAVPRARKAR
jgi:Hg(II)-responsive transcriptional regulator